MMKTSVTKVPLTLRFSGDVRKKANLLKEQNLVLAEETATIKASEAEAEKAARDAEIEFSPLELLVSPVLRSEAG